MSGATATYAVLHWLFRDEPEAMELPTHAPDGKSKLQRQNVVAVLSYLSVCANRAFVAWPGWDEIIARTGASEKTVERVLGALELAGIVTSQRMNSGRDRRSNLYYINHPDAPHFTYSDADLLALYADVMPSPARARAAVKHRPRRRLELVDNPPSEPVDTDEYDPNVGLATRHDDGYPVTRHDDGYPVTRHDDGYPYKNQPSRTNQEEPTSDHLEQPTSLAPVVLVHSSFARAAGWGP